MVVQQRNLRRAARRAGAHRGAEAARASPTSAACSRRSTAACSGSTTRRSTTCRRSRRCGAAPSRTRCAVYQVVHGRGGALPRARTRDRRSRSRLADLLRLLGRGAEAEAAWQAALPTLAGLAADRPDDRSLAYDVARCHEDLAQLALERGDGTRAEAGGAHRDR
jgi:hypothetical protein